MRRIMTEVARGTASGPTGEDTARDGSRLIYNGLVWLLFVGALILSWGPAEMWRWPFLFTEAGNMARYASGFLEPDFSDWRFYLQEMLSRFRTPPGVTLLRGVLPYPSGFCPATTWRPGWACHRVRARWAWFGPFPGWFSPVPSGVALGSG